MFSFRHRLPWHMKRFYLTGETKSKLALNMSTRTTRQDDSELAQDFTRSSRPCNVAKCTVYEKIRSVLTLNDGKCFNTCGGREQGEPNA